MCLVGLVLASYASPSAAKVNAVVDSAWTSWSNTVYYFAMLYGPNAPYTNLAVNVTAVDNYELYVNGSRVDTPAKNDGKWETIDQYSATADGTTKEVFVAVKVTNRGIGNGDGLLVDIKAGPDWLGTTVLKRRIQFKDDLATVFPVTWYYFDGDESAIRQVLDPGQKDPTKRKQWYQIDSSFFTNISSNRLFRFVMLGKMGNINYTPDSHVQVVTGYLGDIDVGSTAGGGITLRRIDGEDIALYKPCEDEKLTDGNVGTGLLYTGSPMNSTKRVDLVNTYRVNKLTLYTGGSDPAEYPRSSSRGFAAEISLDSFRFEEMNVIYDIGITNADNGGYDYAEVSFPPQYARYVRYNIIATRPTQLNIGEMMIFGTGYTGSGVYLSPWLTLGDSAAYKNIDMVTWDGDTPSGTGITVQTKTKSAVNGVESKWSPAHTERSFAFDSPEPVLFVQYRVNLTSGDPDKTPVFKSLHFRFSKNNQPLVSGKASIIPTSVPMGVDTSFVYSIVYKLAAGQDIKTVAISVPNITRVDSLISVGLNKTLKAPSDFTFFPTSDSLYVTLTTPLNKQGDDELRVYFRTLLLKNVHEFGSGVLNSTGNDGAGLVKISENTDFS